MGGRSVASSPHGNQRDGDATRTHRQSICSAVCAEAEQADWTANDASGNVRNAFKWQIETGTNR
jgi:hypothetical protein